MSFGGGGSQPLPLRNPRPSPAPPTQADTSVVEAGARARRNARVGGYASTIATGGMGLTDRAKTAPKLARRVR